MRDAVEPGSVPAVLVSGPEGLDLLEAELASAVRVSVDTETHAATSFRDGIWSALRVISLAVRRQDGSVGAFVVDFRDVDAARLAPVLAGVRVAHGWNASFDDRVLTLARVPVPVWRDAMLSDGLLHSGSSGFEFWHSLAFAARKYLGFEMSGKGGVQTSYDAVSDLTSEQVSYAAQDAVVTLLVSEEVDARVDAAGLTVPVDLEQAARPFILEMTERGIPFSMDAWREQVLGEAESRRAEALRELADLTGGSEVTLFGESEGPSWNPDSDAQVREALNTYARAAVERLTGGRPFARTDRLDKMTLKQLDHPLPAALLRYREQAKLLSTYGANLEKYVDVDGRIHPRYKQGGVVATGRLASDRPNAQNFSPRQKPFFRPPARVAEDGSSVERVFVYADLSQVELRVLAQESGDARMQELFRLGGDFHARTAADMFHLDMDALRTSDPEAYSSARKKAKGVNFGIPYGLGAAALGTSLTVNSGVPTSTEEARAMLQAYAEAYPAVDAWLRSRDAEVRRASKRHAEVDWDLSFAVYELHSLAAPASKSLARRLGRQPTLKEVSEEVLPDDRLPEEGRDGARAEHVDRVMFALSFDVPVCLSSDGSPVTFESRTRTGRRRLFTIPMDSSSSSRGHFDGVVTSAALVIATSDKPAVAALRAEFAERHGLNLPGPKEAVRREGESEEQFSARASTSRRDLRTATVKEFEGANRPLKYELLRFVSERMGDGAVRGHLLPMAFSDQVRALGNAFRNHPIQSLVADIGLAYYAALDERLERFSEAFPVQAVHDSITIECDLADARAIRDLVRSEMEAALARWCPDVPAVADADVRRSFDDADVIPDDELPG